MNIFSLSRDKDKKGKRVSFSYFNGVSATEGGEILGESGAMKHLIGEPCINSEGRLTVKLLTNGYHEIRYRRGCADCRVGASRAVECVRGDPIRINDLSIQEIVEEKKEEACNEYSIKMDSYNPLKVSLSTDSFRLRPKEVKEAIIQTIECRNEKQYCPYCGQKICDC